VVVMGYSFYKKGIYNKGGPRRRSSGGRHLRVPI
jgi:hypothetical protein